MPVYATPAPITVTLELSVGEVRLVASDRTDTVVEVRPCDERDDSDVLAAQQTRVDYADGTLTVRGPKHRLFDFSKRTRSVAVRVELPAGSAVRGDLTAGDVHSSGVLGECRFKTSVGHLRLDRTGPARLETVGHITVEAIGGAADIATGSGDVRIGEVGGAAAVKNSNGSTDIGTVAGNLRVRAANGAILLIVLYGIGTDYILFLLFRYRERLRAGDDKQTAMVVSVQRVGEVIASAAGAVVVAFLVLLLASLGFFGSLGPGLAIAVGVMLITSLTLIPALVSKLGRFVFWPSKAWQHPPKATISRRLGTLVGRRPALVAALSGLVLLALAAGTLSYKADYDFSAGFPQDTESALAQADLGRAFAAGAAQPTEVYLTTTDGSPLNQQAVEEFAAAAKGGPGVGQVRQAVPGSRPDVVRIDVLLNINPVSNQAIELVRDDLRDYLHAKAPAGTKALVGGTTAVFADINTANNRDLSVILPVAAALIAIILALLLRSLVAPVYLVVAVLLNFAATLGATVYVFQGFQGKPGVTFQLPIILYLFVVAIGTDYNILMIARLREEAREGKEPREAAALGVEHGGPTVAAAGLILAGTFGVLMLAPISFLQQMGFAVAIGIVLSAFVMSFFFVPAFTALIGHAAWWPGHGDRAPVPHQPAAGPVALEKEPDPTAL